MKYFRFLKKKRPFKLTRGGYIFILYTIGVGAGAINTGNNLLYLIFGLFLGLILASGVLSDLALWGVGADPLMPQSGQAGQTFYIPFRVTNSKRWFSSLSVRVEMEGQVRDQTLAAQTYCPSIDRQSSTSVLMTVHPSARGWLEISRLKLSTRFPFGLLDKSWGVPVEEGHRRVLIYPALLPLDEEVVQSISDDQELLSEWSRKGDGVNPYGIREFQASDSPKRIHWRASAKKPTGWLVKEMEQDRDQQVKFIWPDESFFIGWSSAEFETFVSFAASLVQRLQDLRKETLFFVTREKNNFRIEKDLLWEFLALVEKSPGAFLGAEAAPMDESLLSLGECFNRWRKKRAA